MREDFSVPTKKLFVAFRDGTSKTYRANAIELHDGFVVLYLIGRDVLGPETIMFAGEPLRVLVAAISAQLFSSIEVLAGGAQS